MLSKKVRKKKKSTSSKKTDTALNFTYHHATRMSSFKEPTAGEAKILFEKLEKKFPSKTLGAGKWYLVAVGPSSSLNITLA